MEFLKQSRYVLQQCVTGHKQVGTTCGGLEGQQLRFPSKASLHISKNNSRIEDIYALSYWEGNSRSMGCVHPKAARDDDRYGLVQVKTCGTEAVTRKC